MLKLNDPTLKIFPNPANEKVNIQVNGTAAQLVNTTLTLHDVIGKEVMSINANSLGSSFTIETNDFNQGIYIVSLNKDNAPIYTQRLIINH